MPILNSTKMTTLKNRLRGKGDGLAMSPLTVLAGVAVSGAARAKLGRPDGSWKFGASDVDVEPVVGLALIALSIQIPKRKAASASFDLGTGVFLGYIGNAAFRTARKL